MLKFRKHLSVFDSIQSYEPLVLMSGSVDGEISEATADFDSPIEAFHRDGQTFLTWLEDDRTDGEEFHVYRHTEQITADNLSSAEKLTDRWGPLDDDTSVHRLATNGAPSNFVIQDLGAPLSDDVGLFVYTTQPDDSATAYYAVTIVVNGQEQIQSDGILGMSTAVTESVADSSAVLVRSVNGGLGQIFTHFMDYEDWNPTFQGYAYNYAVALPEGYDASREYPLKLELHAYSEVPEFRQSSEFNWPAIQVYVDDPGGDRGTIHTWWYGFAADHNYLTDGDIPTTGVIENFTEQRILKTIDEVSDRFLVDGDRVHARGHSMGASGALALGIRYGNVFSGIYASQPMTNFSADTRFESEFVQLWGNQQDNLLIRNEGPESGLIARYGVDGDRQTGVWDWMDHGQQLQRRRGEDIAFLMFGHGKADRVIDWETQGRPFVSAVEASGVGYSARSEEGLGHAWIGFGASVPTLFNGIGDWTFDGSQPYLAFSNASSNGDLSPAPNGTDEYNLTIDWSTASNAFHSPIVDSTERFEVTIRSLNGAQTANVTPRQFNQFIVSEGEGVFWSNVDNATGEVLQRGQSVADSDGLITITGMQLGTDLGNRLILTRDPSFVAEPPTVQIPVVNPNPIQTSPVETFADDSALATPPTLPPAALPPVDTSTDDVLPDESFLVGIEPAPPIGFGDSAAFETEVVPDQDTSAEIAEFNDNAESVENSTDRLSFESGPTDLDSTSAQGIVTGTKTGEWLSSNEAHTVDAGAGDDEIHASIGENTIDGGAGADILVVYEGTSQDFQIARLENGDVIVEGLGVDGQPVKNTLRNVERINFNDRSILIDELFEQSVEPARGSGFGPDRIFGRAIQQTSGAELASGFFGNAQGTFGAEIDLFNLRSDENVIDGAAEDDVLVFLEGGQESFGIQRFAGG